MDTPGDFNQVDQALSRLQVLADRFSSEFDQLRRGHLGAPFWTTSGASTYCEQRQMTLQAMSNEFWFLRLGMVWDTFPQHRRVALHACQQQIQEIAAMLSEWVREDTTLVRLMILPSLTKASELLLRPQEEITTEQFIEGVSTLATIAGLAFGPQEEDMAPAQQWWGVEDVSKGMCRRLHALFVPQVMQE